MDICWNGISRKEVNSDKGAGPCHSKHASTLSVERRTVAPNGSFHTAADGIIKLAIKVIIIGYTRLSVGWWVEGAISVRMQGHIDLLDVVEALVDIDLTIRARVIANCPTEVKRC